MSTIAIIGAGPGLGAATARRFAREEYAVALIARNPDRLDQLAAELSSEGHTACGFAADVRDPEALGKALGVAARELGDIDVLQYSPVPQPEFLRPVLDTTREDLRGAVEFSIYGPVAAAHQVLPGMRARRHGSILFVNGGSAVRPNVNVAGTSIAFAGEGAFASMLHDSLAPEGIAVRQLIIPGGIRDGHPTHSPPALADTLWRMHTEPGAFRVVVEESPGS